MKILFKIVFVLIASIFLFGCNHNHKYFEKVQLMTADDYHASAIIKQLRNRGVDVFVSNDKKNNSKIELFIYANDIFNENSANFNPAAYALLDTIVNLFEFYEEEVVQVVCNQSGVASETKSSALALARAHQIVDYLWEEDIDASFIYADKSNQIPKGYVKISFQNYRRQI